jgi:peptidoglycan/LPS O-acetylase OafA/YrhL
VSQNRENILRVSAIDFYRGIAVLMVVLFHFFNTLPYGFLGVDLFFVISGFLVGGILIRNYHKGEIPFIRFILQRGFKIWPSYFFFLLVGGIISYWVYSKSDRTDLYVPIADLPRYLFFYRNFRGEPHHWTFDHVWSLCIEEHFYIILPLIFIVLLRLPGRKDIKLYVVSFLIIFSGLFFKHLALFYTNGKDTYAATYNRLDALSYGVLLYLVVYHPIVSLKRYNKYIFVIGIMLLAILISLDVSLTIGYYNKVIFHSLIPFAFILILFSTIEFNFKYFNIIKFISKYSYNIYLWHPMLVYLVYFKFGNGITGLFIYLITSLMIGILFTKIIEIPMLNSREKLIRKILN